MIKYGMICWARVRSHSAAAHMHGGVMHPRGWLLVKEYQRTGVRDTAWQSGSPYSQDEPKFPMIH